MALNVNNVKSVLSKTVSKVNSKGASLLRKDTAQRVSKAVKEGLKVPEGAKTYDAVRVGRKFNPNENYTDIFTFRDKDGKILQRYTKVVDGKNVTETKKAYETLYSWEKDLVEDGSEVMDIFGKKTRSFTRENGKISKLQEDVFAITDEPKPYLTHFKKQITPAAQEHFPRTNKENILLEQRRNGEKAKYIKNEYEVDKYCTGGFRLVDSKASSKELEEIAKNSYFLPFVSSHPKFVNRMANACVSDAKFIAVDPQISLYKNASGYNGYFSQGGSVNINLKSSRDLARTRESLTETIGHEVGHAKWDEKCLFYDMYEAGFDGGDFLRNFSKAEIPDIKRYRRSIESYITPAMSKKGYYEQFCEKAAREDGKKAIKKYVDLNDRLNRQFPNKHGFQFYHPLPAEDDLQGLFSLMNAWL